MASIITQTSLAFTKAAVLPNGEIQDLSWAEYTQGHDALLFFYPLNFTFVCPSELIALQKRMKDFNDRGIKVVAVSIDSVHSHASWRKLPTDKGGIGAVDYPLVSDLDRQICQHYQVEHPSEKVALRSSILVDNKGVVRAQITCDLPLGRDIGEILRLFDAIQFSREHGEVCPAGWREGRAGMKANAQGVQDYLKSHIDEL